MYAALNRHTQAVEPLIAVGNRGYEFLALTASAALLRAAACNGHARVVELLIAAGADLDAKENTR
jgi:hypothetical protein